MWLFIECMLHSPKNYSYSTVPWICGSNRLESEGVAQGRGWFTNNLVNPSIKAKNTKATQLNQCCNILIEFRLYSPPDWSFVVITNLYMWKCLQSLNIILHTTSVYGNVVEWELIALVALREGHYHS